MPSFEPDPVPPGDMSPTDASPRDERTPQARAMDAYWAAVDALTERAQANHAALAALHAERATIMADALTLIGDRVAQRAAERSSRSGSLSDDISLREVSAELGSALRVSDRTIRQRISDAWTLTTQYPTTHAALAAGRIDERHVSAIIDGGAIITDDDSRARYEEQILEVATTQSAPRVREHARVIAARLQPDAVDLLHQRAHEARRVRVFDLEDGLSRLIADLPAVKAHAIQHRLTDIARALDETESPAAQDGHDRDDAATDAADDAADDGRRTMDQRRADILSDLLLGVTAVEGELAGVDLDAIRATVHVTVPVLTLAGIGDEPAVLAGHGPIDAETARRLAATAPGWDRVMFHPHSGAPLSIDRYRPHPALRRFLTARDQHCRWPGCRQRAERCDADHTIAAIDGGPTCASNLSLLCRHHHVLKHASPWQIRQRGDATMEFTSPTGRRYVEPPPPTVQFVPRDDLWPPPVRIGADAPPPPW